MEITSEARDGKVLERRFTLTVGDEAVPGIHWLPADATEPHATVCIGHGGFQHKRIDNVARARPSSSSATSASASSPSTRPSTAIASPIPTPQARTLEAIRNGDRDAMRSRLRPRRPQGDGGAGRAARGRVAGAARRPADEPAVGRRAVRLVGRLDGHHARAAARRRRTSASPPPSWASTPCATATTGGRSRPPRSRSRCCSCASPRTS